MNHLFKKCSISILFIILLCGSLFLIRRNSKNPPVFHSIPSTEAPGKEMLGETPLTLDISNISKGYMTVIPDSSSESFCIQITTPMEHIVSYFTDPSESIVIPFTDGDGEYLISCYKHLTENQYTNLYNYKLDIKIKNKFFPFLFPNQYVNFSSDSQAISIASQLAKQSSSDLETLDLIYQYVIEHIKYDTSKAETVEKGYVPEIDKILTIKKGICFDYAALTAAMLRSQGIPCKLQTGYSGDIKHAWIEVYICSKGTSRHGITFEGNTWKRMDPTFDANETDKAMIYEYIGDNSNYILQTTY